MNTYKRLKLLLVGVIVALTSFVGLTYADNPGYVDIHVSISNSKSLQALTSVYAFGAIAVNTASHSATGLTIRNDSNAIIETYRLSAGDAISDTGLVNWALDTSTSTDQYMLYAQFTDTRPNLDVVNWANDMLNGTPTDCTTAAFGDGANADQDGELVEPTAADRDRSLFFRIVTPDVVSDPGGHTATVTLAVK